MPILKVVWVPAADAFEVEIMTDEASTRKQEKKTDRETMPTLNRLAIPLRQTDLIVATLTHCESIYSVASSLPLIPKAKEPRP
jgi:hypothetical protein